MSGENVINSLFIRINFRITIRIDQKINSDLKTDQNRSKLTKPKNVKTKEF